MKKLYKLTKSGATLPAAVDNQHQVILKDASKIPCLWWPDGRWCVEANLWVLDLYNKGRSRTERGGTLLSYTTNISHLVRYAHAQKTRLLEITDIQFGFFIISLLGERNSQGAKIRNQNSVANICRNCLTFIDFIGKTFGVEPRLTIKRKPTKIRLLNGLQVSRMTLWNPATPQEARRTTRFPINIDAIKKLRLAAASNINSSRFVRERRRVMIRLLEMTGGRRLEINLITVSSVIKANSTGSITLTTAKQGGSTSTTTQGSSKTRELPVSRLDLKMLMDFIHYYRAPVIDSFLKIHEDHDRLLISERTGLPLTSNHITAELAGLRRLAGLSEPISPHLFRHRFVTKIFVAELLNKKIESLGTFKSMLLDTESLKRKVMELTGHRDSRSLDIYIHLAWDEANLIRSSLPSLEKLQQVEAIRENLMMLQADLKLDSHSEEVNTILDLINRFESLL
ncbi:tyrosine-type recombinase/integrase [Pseudomonas sp. FBF18]|uniref:tyrosine-type recombinase/integrase n=1 Tax=Pseudomonas sp. FBF18 TaxID=1451377 RepID=UPI0020C37ECA|nr:tyrosine-type recombinase/integrase [Pseudomonas sp. FBF18]